MVASAWSAQEFYMPKSMLLLIFLPLCLAFALGQTSQMKAGQPPKYLQIIVEEVRAGKMAAHNHLEAEWTDALKKAGIKGHYLGASSLAGQSEALWLLLHDGLGEVEELREQEATNSASQVCCRALFRTGFRLHHRVQHHVGASTR